MLTRPGLVFLCCLTSPISAITLIATAGSELLQLGILPVYVAEGSLAWTHFYERGPTTFNIPQKEAKSSNFHHPKNSIDNSRD